MPRLAIALLLLLLSLTSAVAQERRIALVIGIDAYGGTASGQLPSLRNAVADARALRGALRGLGFQIVGTDAQTENVTREQLLAMLSRFSDEAQGAAVALISFHGHGLAAEGRESLLLPRDFPVAVLHNPLHRRSAALTVDDLSGVLDRTGARRKILIADACREELNALPSETLARGGGLTRGLIPIDPPAQGLMVIYAAEHRQVAYDRLHDNDTIPNGVFMRYFLPQLRTPGRSLIQAVERTEQQVTAATQGLRDGVQHVGFRVRGGQFSDLVLAGSEATRPAPEPQPAPAALELAFWQSIQGSQNVADFDEYLRRYPQGNFAGLARNRVAALRTPAPPDPAPQPGSGYPVPVGESFRDCPECPEMVVIQAGRSVMGSLRGEVGRHPNEGPLDGPPREVTLRAPLAVGKYEVTRGQFAAFQRSTAWPMKGGCNGLERSWWGSEASRSWSSPGFVQTDEHPVVCVSWDDAQAYVGWLSVRTGQRYRLLTEAEWEYAARAGTTTPYSFGHTIDQKQANFLGRGSVGRTQPVGSYPRNGWGLHDMHGNVFEWVEDCYRESYEGLTGDASQAVNQANCDVKSAFMRVMRGGCWGCDSGRLRSETRNASVPSSRSSLIGFRVARTPGS